jgi:LPXTG-motif cell wall-anchored protein
MNTQRFVLILACSLLAFAVLLVCTAGAAAQETTQTTVSHGTSEQQVSVEHGEVVYVSGNDLVVKDLDTGQLRNFVIPDSARATVEGQEMSVHDLKPGMKLQRTITTTTTPKVVTTVKTIQGTVFHVNAPVSVILSTPDGNKQYKIPKDQKFMINGEEVDAFHLRKGMKINATVITDVPETEIAHEQKVTGQMPPPPATPPLQGALLLYEPARPALAAQSTVAKAEAPKLPQTGSALPLMGLLGVLLSGIGVLRLWRTP